MQKIFRQTEQTEIRLLRKQSDQGIHCLLFPQVFCEINILLENRKRIVFEILENLSLKIGKNPSKKFKIIQIVFQNQLIFYKFKLSDKIRFFFNQIMFRYRHRAINLFLKCYRHQWLANEEYEKKILIDDLTVSVDPVRSL